MHGRRRSLSPSANPRGGVQPYVSLEGHNIIDVRFGRSDDVYVSSSVYPSLV